MSLSGAIRLGGSMSKDRHDTRKAYPRRKRPKKCQTKLEAGELLFQPWFLSWRTARTITSLVPADYRKRMRDYFDDYGCMRCGRLDVPYQSNAMCRTCMATVRGRLTTLAC